MQNQANKSAETLLQAEAGEKVLLLDKIDKYLILIEGPAGLKIVKKYGIDEKGFYRLSDNVITLVDKDLYSEGDLKKIILI